MTKKETKMMETKLKKEDEFIPPDGGWGWMIVVAAGFSNLSTLPTLQQFGLLFRDKFARLGMSSSEIGSIINIHAAVASCVGLANGPLFRIFSYRQVSLVGAVFIFTALLFNTLSYNFTTYLLTFSILYGAGYGVNSSANALALNTYWKKRRRLATGLSWTATGLGPIIWPQLITLMFDWFGENGTILLLSGFGLHSIACSLLLQPVEWHSKEVKMKDEENLIVSKTNGQLTAIEEKESGYFSHKLKNISAFSSQYLFNEDDPRNTGYEITDPGTPMMIRANDGYFSTRSRLPSRGESNRPSRMSSQKPSMTNLNENRSNKSSMLYLNESKKNSASNLKNLAQDPSLKQKRKTSPKRKNSITLKTLIPESEIEDCPTLKAPHDLKEEEKAIIEQIDPEKAKLIADKADMQTKTGSRSLKSFKMDVQYNEKYNKNSQSNVSLKQLDDIEDKQYLRDNHSNQSYRGRYRKKSNNFNYENEVLKLASEKLEEYLKETNAPPATQNHEKMPCVMVIGDENVFEENEENIEPLTFCQKVAIFFDLDLLKDFTFVNLMLGMTLASFNELNFSILTPFILGDFGLSKTEVATYLSLLGGVDISVRFCVPFIAGKVGWHNNTFFLFGVLTMAFGRVVLAYWQNTAVLMTVAVIIGFGKGLRTVFMALVIPTHVPLHKLPGASGIQLLTAGIVYTVLGPVVGWINGNTSPAVTLHCLNIFTYLTALSWGLEKFIRNKRQKEINE